MDDDKVTQLPVRFKAPHHDKPMIGLAIYDGKCSHIGPDAHYNVRPGETEVECGKCHTRLDPVFVLVQLAHVESRFRQAHERYIEESKRLAERLRTKCQHCGKFTRIRRD